VGTSESCLCSPWGRSRHPFKMCGHHAVPGLGAIGQ